jgi:hypothetical protein
MPPQRLPLFCWMRREISAMKQRSQFDFDAESNFRGLPPPEIEAACKYEYLRKSRALTDKVNNEPQSSIGPYRHRLDPYRERLVSLCKADWPLRRPQKHPPQKHPPQEQYIFQKSRDPNATSADYRIYCRYCDKAADLPCDDWVNELFETAQREAVHGGQGAEEVKKSTKCFAPASFFSDETLTRGEIYRLVFALRKAGFPRPWTTLKKNARKELISPISEWYEQRKKSYPPIVIEEATPERDLQRELASPIWKLTPLKQRKPEIGADVEARLWRPALAAPGEPDLLHSGQQSNRKYLYFFIRIDPSYNQTALAKAFREWLGNRWQRSKSGGGRHWQSLLNQLAVMRIWKHESDQWKRLKLVKKYCGYSGCVKEAEAYKERCKQGCGDEPMSEAAKVEMSSARAEARTFFQSLFPGEEPLSY